MERTRITNKSEGVYAMTKETRYTFNALVVNFNG